MIFRIGKPPFRLKPGEWPQISIAGKTWNIDRRRPFCVSISWPERVMKLLDAKTWVLVLTLASFAAPAGAQTPVHHRRHRHHYDGCVAERRRRGNNGTAIGAVGGGIAGSALSHGSLGGVLLGAGAGAVAGHQIARSGARC
jgi:hypothetical protein